MQLNYLHYSPNLARVKAPRGNLEVGLSSQSEKEVANVLSVELIANLPYSPKLARVPRVILRLDCAVNPKR